MDTKLLQNLGEHAARGMSCYIKTLSLKELSALRVLILKQVKFRQVMLSEIDSQTERIMDSYKDPLLP